MNRRKLLGLLGTSPVAAPMVIKDAMDQAARGVEVCADDIWGQDDDRPPEQIRAGSALADLMVANRAMTGRGRMPARIATKKSWSPAFKEHLFVAEEVEFNRLERAYHSDKEFRNRVVSFFSKL